MEFGGRFILNPGEPNEQVTPNAVLTDGCEYFLRTLFRAEAILPANFYIGLTNAAGDFNVTFATIAAGEPNVAQGYARQPAVRGVGDWTVTKVGNTWKATSKKVTFTSTGTYDKDFIRLFLCNIVSTSAGKLFALGAPLLVPQHVINGDNPGAIYEFWMRQ